MSSFKGHRNLTAGHLERQWSWWGRILFHVDGVDALHWQALAQGLTSESNPTGCVQPNPRMGCRCQSVMPYPQTGRRSDLSPRL